MRVSRTRSSSRPSSDGRNAREVARRPSCENPSSDDPPDRGQPMPAISRSIPIDRFPHAERSKFGASPRLRRVQPPCEGCRLGRLRLCRLPGWIYRRSNRSVRVLSGWPLCLEFVARGLWRIVANVLIVPVGRVRRAVSRARQDRRSEIARLSGGPARERPDIPKLLPAGRGMLPENASAMRPSCTTPRTAPLAPVAPADSRALPGRSRR